jgi:ligand-binding sensor domain-containing protein
MSMKKFSLILVLISVLVFSCNEKPKKAFIGPDAKSYKYKFKPLSDTLLPPEVIELTAANAPQSIAIEPKTIQLKYPLGMAGLSSTKYGAAEGLQASQVQDLAIDHSGNLWVGGLGSLSKFDGTAFTNFSPANGGGNLFVTHLLVDSEGTLWIGNFDNSGLHKYDGKFFKHILPNLEKGAVINHLVEGLEGTIWVGSSKGIYRVQGDSVTHYGIEHGLPDDYITSLLSLPDKGILIFTSKGNLLFTGKHFEPFTGIPTLTGFRPSYQDRNGNVWFSLHSDGKFRLGKYDGRTTFYFSEEQGLSDPGFINKVFEDRKGKIWVLSQNAVFILHGGKFIRYPNKEIGVQGVSSIVEDQTGSLWMGSLDGLFKINTGMMDKIEIPQIPGDKSFLPQLSLGKTAVKWVILNHTLLRYDQTTTTAYDFKPIMGAFVRGFYADKKGHVWISIGGAKRNLIQFDGKKFLVFNGYKAYTKLDFIENISEDPVGNLVFTGAGGITLFDGKQFTHYGQQQGFPSSGHKYLLDSKQRKWVGTSDDGAWVYTADSVLHLNTENGLQNNFIDDLAEDPSGNIWLATDAGLSRFDGKKLTKIGEAEGLATIVGGLNVNLADSLLWVGTANGLYKLPFAETNSPSPRLISYSPLNGYEFIPGMVASQQSIQSDSVGLWMNSLSDDDIVRFNYKSIQEFEPPALTIENIRINNSHLLWSQLAESGERQADSLMFLNESALKFGKTVDSKKIEELSNAFGKIHFDSLKKENFIPENLRLPYANNSITFETRRL